MSQFSIDAFRANLLNGIARNNLFLVQGNFPGASLGAVNVAAAAAGSLLGAAAGAAVGAVGALAAGTNDNSRVSFLVQSADIPQSTIAKGAINYMGRQFQFPGDRSYADWPITVYNDGDYTLRKAFEKWMNLINSGKTNIGPNAMNAYMTDWFISPLTREGNAITTYKLVGCWPTIIGNIGMNMQPDANPSTFQATIAYQYHEIANITT
jgi:hypothetical protein